VTSESTGQSLLHLLGSRRRAWGHESFISTSSTDIWYHAWVDLRPITYAWLTISVNLKIPSVLSCLTCNFFYFPRSFSREGQEEGFLDSMFARCAQVTGKQGRVPTPRDAHSTIKIMRYAVSALLTLIKNWWSISFDEWYIYTVFKAPRSV
jgi:hypothetical protein